MVGVPREGNGLSQEANEHVHEGSGLSQEAGGTSQEVCGHVPRTSVVCRLMIWNALLKWL